MDLLSLSLSISVALSLSLSEGMFLGTDSELHLRTLESKNEIQDDSYPAWASVLVFQNLHLLSLGLYISLSLSLSISLLLSLSLALSLYLSMKERA